MSSGTTSIQSQFNLNADNSNSGLIYEFENFRLDAALLMLYEDQTAVARSESRPKRLAAPDEKLIGNIGGEKLTGR